MLLNIDNINVSYGSFMAIRGISLGIKEGEIVCILGANGAGKTTLIKTICGIIKVNSGLIEFNNKRIDRLPSYEIIKNGISVCPEAGGCFPKMTVHKNLILGAFNCDDKNLIQENYEKVTDLFPIFGERKEQLAGLLSGGERQMLSIGRALMGNPKLIMLDEPSMGLGPMIVKSIYESILKIGEQGATILLVEQNAAISLKISHRGYVIAMGKIAIHGTSKELNENEDVKKAYISM